MAGTVLIVEDDPNAVEIVTLYLRRDGYKVLSAGDGGEGLRLAREMRPDLVVLDLMLPSIDGMEVCRQLREESAVPIIMLTARVEEEDRLEGLELGADDYVTKPFSPKELSARVRAVLRRTSRIAPDPGPSELSYGEIKVDMLRRAVWAGERQVHLTPTEFHILAIMMRQPGYPVSRERIIDRVLGADFEGFDRTVDAHVSNLRRKVERAANGARYIHTVYGVGYRFGDA